MLNDSVFVLDDIEFKGINDLNQYIYECYHPDDHEDIMDSVYIKSLLKV